MNFQIMVTYKDTSYIIAQFMEKKDAVWFAKNKVKKLREKMHDPFYNLHTYLVIDKFNDEVIYNSSLIYE